MIETTKAKRREIDSVDDVLRFGCSECKSLSKSCKNNSAEIMREGCAAATGTLRRAMPRPVPKRMRKLEVEDYSSNWRLQPSHGGHTEMAQEMDVGSHLITCFRQGAVALRAPANWAFIGDVQTRSSSTQAMRPVAEAPVYHFGPCGDSSMRSWRRDS